MMVSFVLSFFPRDVLDEILNLIESVSEDFPSYFCKKNTLVPPEEGKLSSRHISHVQVDHVSTKIEDKGTLDVQKKHAFKLTRRCYAMMVV